MARIDYDDRSSPESTAATAPTVSFELYPPRDAASEAALLRDLPALVAADPEFISVTYGANGSSRGVSIGMLRQLQDAGVQPMAHLTCVGTTYAEAGALIREFLDSGVTSFLALRGDPPAGVDPADIVLGDLGSAAELVQLIHRMQAEREPFRREPIAGFPGTARLTRGNDVTIAVAAFPNGHPRSRSRRQDIDTLLAKEAAGANLAITQLFFDPDDYLGFVDEARAAGVTMRILPGTLAVLSVARLRRVLEISEEREPRELLAALEGADTPEQAAAIGIEHAARLCRALLDGGAPGLHLYTFNRSAAPLAVLGELGLYRNQEIHA